MILIKVCRIDWAVKLRKKNVEFVWEETQQKTFDQLKLTFAKRPVVKIFDITLTTDTSEHSISRILSQEGHPIMYLSRRLTNIELNYWNIERKFWQLYGHHKNASFLSGKIFVKMWS